MLGERAAEYREPRLPARLDRVPVLRVVENLEYSEGKTSSVKAGLRAIDAASSTFVPLAVDSPRTAELLDAMIEAHLAGGRPVTYPVYDGRDGHPPLFDLALPRRASRDLRGARGLARGEAARSHARAPRHVHRPPLVIVNMNTPEAYRHALELTGQDPAIADVLESD